MIFDDNIPISRQLVEYCHSQVMTGSWRGEERIPSTKDLAVQLGVNPRTVMKAYDEMASDGIIYQRRGMGYFASADAPERIVRKRREDFVNNTVPALRRSLVELGITPEELMILLKE